MTAEMVQYGTILKFVEGFIIYNSDILGRNFPNLTKLILDYHPIVMIPSTSKAQRTVYFLNCGLG